MRTVDFTAMKDGTAEDYPFLKPLEHDHVRGTATRVLRELELQQDETLPGYKSEPLEAFATLVAEIFARKAYAPEVIQKVIVKDLPPL